MYVAAYFAAESTWDQDGAIWVFNAARLRDYTLRTRQAMIDRGELDEATCPNPGTVVQQLAAMNVTAASLFPNIDGFGRSIQSQVRLQASLEGAVVV
jgi:hypothetical protein